MPTRYLKPGICDSETIDRCSPIAECLFYRLLVNVDDFGRIDARPAVIRAKCFPLKDKITNKDTEKLLNELASCGLILLYNSSGCVYLQMQKWDNLPRAKESKCPKPTNTCIQMYADVCNSHTVLPVTVTVTGTKTGTDKPKPETGTKTIAPLALLTSLGIDEKIAADWILLRKQKKSPVTETALDGIKREAEKAGYSLETALRVCCERGWAGFKAEWVLNQVNGRMPAPENFAAKDYGSGVTPL